MTPEEVKAKADEITGLFYEPNLISQMTEEGEIRKAEKRALIAVQRTIKILNDELQDIKYVGNDLIQLIERERAIETELKLRI